MTSTEITRRPVRIFVSYRREDSAGEAGRLCADLQRRFGKSNIFMDVTTIGAGERWTVKIDEALDACDVLLCLIGRHWVSVTHEDGRRRLDHTEDRHRREIEAALGRDIVVIPVLVQDASMPVPAELPEELRALAERQATRLDHGAYENDLRSLVRRINAATQGAGQAGTPPTAPARARPSGARKTPGAARSDAVDRRAVEPPKSDRRWMVRPLPLALLSLVLLAATGWWWFGDPLRRSGRARQTLDPEKARVASAEHPDSPKKHPIIDDCAQPEHRDPSSHACPKLVAIPPGSFQMGWAPEDEDPTKEGLPPHHVDIPRGFAVGKYEVTREEYEQFVSETGRLEAPCQKLERADDPESWEDVPGQTWRSPGFEQDRHHPVVCVSWNDAKAYVAWLSRKTGREYRLLTESEWEYAARAHTTTARYRTDDPALLCKYINHGDLDYSDRHPQDAKVNDKCKDGYAFTSPVGMLWENAFGLHDMLGNVWEWVEDCWNANYVGAPTDGRAWTSGNCDRHVLRGGGWKFSPEKARSAYRVAYRAGFRHDSAGFRVARSLSAGESVGLQADSP